MTSNSGRPTVLATNPNADLYGASRMLLESIEGFLDEGWRVVACIPSEGRLNEEIRGRGGETRDVPSPTLRKTYLHPLGLLRLIWLTARAIPSGIRTLRAVRPDVVYVNTVIQPLWLILAWCLRIPVICHDHEAESSAPRFVQRAMALPLRCARTLIINSRFSMGVLVHAMPSLEDRCVVVLNGVAGPPEVTPARPNLEGPVKLLYVGRISERKGVEDVVDAIEILRSADIDARLDVVGSVFPGYESVEDGLHRQISAAGSDDRVFLHGFEDDVWSRLRGSDVLVVPSRTDEPFGNTAVEGMLAARPVVATRTSGLIEATEGYEAAVSVDPANPAAIADAVSEIVASWPELRDAALRDAEVAAARHSPQRYRSTVLELTRALLG